MNEEASDRRRHRPGRGNLPGEVSLSMGVVAIVFAVFPILGELIAAPASLFAIAFGLVGLRRSERGLASNVRQSLVGAVLGVVALLLVLLFFAATIPVD